MVNMVIVICLSFTLGCRKQNTPLLPLSTINLSVVGVECTDCAVMVEKMIKQCSNVEYVVCDNIQGETAQLVISYRGTLPQQEIKKLLEDEGFYLKE